MSARLGEEHGEGGGVGDGGVAGGFDADEGLRSGSVEMRQRVAKSGGEMI